jgi:hypothetical protein
VQSTAAFHCPAPPGCGGSRPSRSPDPAIKDAKQRVAGATWLSTRLYCLAIFLSGGAAWVIVEYLNVSVGLK